MSVSVYMELKKSSAGITAFPLCLSFAKNTITASTSSFDVATISSEIAQFESNDMISTFDVQEGDDTGIELDDANIITEQFHQKVEKGQIYKDKNLLALVMKYYAVREKCQYLVNKSCPRRFTNECMDERCTWRLKASSLRASNIFQVTKYNSVHSCLNDKRFCSQKQVVSAFVAVVVQDKLVDPQTIYTSIDIQRDIQKAYGMDLSYMQVWRSKEKAIQLLRGIPSGQYKKIPTYLYMLEYVNPGSVTRLHTEVDGSFLYAFIAIYASIGGWIYCRPTVVVDGSFLKSTYRGTILTASTQDVEGQMLPLAYVIVDLENDASWEWFFVQFRETYRQREGICIVSDMHDGIWRETSIVYPEVPHCACMFHLWNNIKTNFRKSQKQIKELYFALARAYTVEEFNRHMAELEAIDSRVKTYLMDIGYDKLSRAHFKANRTMTMTSNIAESVNATNKHARDLPVVNLLDFMTTLIQK
ncbi:uncharacterized protein LOC107806203 [Nicotiana tabacum]|uniref:Uncharacterized protein LOC107806203 n=1 Tax=Nicotiana tabacum TaxID=4097 RepID=A0A1S4BAB3_TOBAC|nr:PREDICTED: uncharacterized protein LOC107806203 [Nicotiana tabacum]